MAPYRVKCQVDRMGEGTVNAPSHKTKRAQVSQISIVGADGACSQC
jgi:hypothetical protein